MKKLFKRIYERNNKTLPILYIVIKILFQLFGKYKELKTEICEVLENYEGKESNESEIKKQYKKLLVYRYIYSLRPNEYYLYDFEKASYKERREFVTRQQTAKYYSVINNKNFRKILDKKNLCYKVFKKYYKRDLICVKNSEDKEELEKFIKNKEKFIIKPFQGHSGDGVEIIDTKKYKTDEELYNYLLDKTPFVAEELIKQSSKLGCFHEQSVNTVRVVTFQYKGDFSILWSFLRTGQGNNNVDNMGAAGMGAFIDINTGKIMTNGIDWKGQEVEEHPDSKIKFKGFQIPYWEDLIETVKNLASELAEMHCIGWDLALTDDGWVLVEGNARPQCVTVQTSTKKGYKKYYEYMYNLVKKLNQEIEM